MKKLTLILGLFFSAVLISCASSNSSNDYAVATKDAKGNIQSIEYNGQCAMAVSQGIFKARGKAKHVFNEASTGKTYYFQSEAAKEKFVSNLDHYRAQADKKWNNFITNRRER